MSDKKNSKQLFKGFSTGSGLRLWLFFLFCFLFLGYSVPLSILLGLAGGIGGGWVMGWWKSSEGPLETPEEEQESELIEEKPKVKGLRLARERREARFRRRSSGTAMPFANFLRR